MQQSALVQQGSKSSGDLQWNILVEVEQFSEGFMVPENCHLMTVPPYLGGAPCAVRALCEKSAVSCPSRGTFPTV